jgi:hypothetical protein
MTGLVVNSHGLGTLPLAVANPTTPSLNCEDLSSMFSYSCWCLAFPNLCSTADYQAAYALANPSVYAPIQPPPPVGAPISTTPGSTLPGDAGQQATGAVQGVLSSNIEAIQAQNQQTMNQTAANLQNVQDIGTATPDSCQTFTAQWPITLSCPTVQMLAIVGVLAWVFMQTTGGRR